MNLFNYTPTHYRLYEHLMSNYNRQLIPKRNLKDPVSVRLSIELYQIIEVNEPQQFVLMNAWVVERWTDELLYWNPADFENISEILLPYDNVWIPDTTLYNSLVMDNAESRRLLNVKLTSDLVQGTTLIEMLYPTLHKFSCLLNLKFFPYDTQECILTFGSWTHDNTGIDYKPFGSETTGIGLHHCLENEGWLVLGSYVERRVMKYACCVNNYTLLEYHLLIQRKPLFFLVNLIMPTSIITLIAIVGFFSSPTINDIRDEKISLGITTLLSMSILIFMVSDKMPSTSSFIPLIGWFYLCMILLISGATLCSSVVIFIQKRGLLGKRPRRKSMFWFRWLGRLSRMEMPLLMKEAYLRKAKKEAELRKTRKISWWQQMRGGINNRHRMVRIANSTQPTVMNVNETNLEKLVNPQKCSITAEIIALASDIDDDVCLQLTGSDEEQTPQKTSCHYQNAPLIVTPTADTLCVPRSIRRRSSSRRNVGTVRTSSKARTRCVRYNEASTNFFTNQRNLAELEYDWIAAVVERCCLIIFCTLFFFMSFGINSIGMYYWWQARKAVVLNVVAVLASIT
uniref:Neurotransmitter-gated ion-channel ligand-binding domain-containing protein n=1 Tax=Ascaris lumbricoides TaxID=6252 RepID=A0A0M3IHQ8_ASCLU